MKKIPLEIIGLSSSHSQLGHYALILGETNGKRRLPIIIGGAEAQAIALELEGIKTNRPMTHDLIYNFTQHFGIEVMEVVINDLKEGIFYARLMMSTLEDVVHEIDSRPSDAVAIAVRSRAPIYCLEHVIQEAGIVVENDEEAEEGEYSLAEIEKSDPLEEEDEIIPSKPKPSGKAPTNEQLADLKTQLDQALASENYEKAARIRDEIQRMEEELGSN